MLTARVILSYLFKKSILSIKPDRVPKSLSNRSKSDKSYWKFHDDHVSELSGDEYKAIHYYTGSGYGEINHFLREGEHWKPERADEVEGHIEHLDNAVNRSWVKNDIVLWRRLWWSVKEPVCGKLSDLGVKSKGRYLEGLDAVQLQKLKGFKFKEPGFCSASLVPLSTGGVVTLKIVLSAGQAGLMINSTYGFDQKTKKHWMSGPDYHQEYEVLLPRDTRFEVISVNILHDRTLVVSVRVLD